MKQILHRLALKLERVAEFARSRRSTGTGVIDPHIGYATPDHIVVRGRVLATVRDAAVRDGQGVFSNIRQMVSLFLTREIGGLDVRCGEVTARTDEEGYFTLLLPRSDTAPGWHEADVVLPSGESTPCPYLVAPADAPAMVISDVDDTVLRTGAWSLARNLWTSFTGNALTREVFEDAVAVFGRLGLPVYYVSSSPWNLHGLLTAIFDRAGLPRGPMFLRDLGLDEQKFITDGHGTHKGQSIDVIMAANPGLSVVLVGDTGQADARIYREAIARHPGRVRAVMLRTPGPGLDAEDHLDLAALRETGVTVFAGRDFAAFEGELTARLAEDHPPDRNSGTAGSPAL